MPVFFKTSVQCMLTWWLPLSPSWLAHCTKQIDAWLAGDHATVGIDANCMVACWSCVGGAASSWQRLLSHLVVCKKGQADERMNVQMCCSPAIHLARTLTVSRPPAVDATGCHFANRASIRPTRSSTHARRSNVVTGTCPTYAELVSSTKIERFRTFSVVPELGGQARPVVDPL